MGGVSSPRHPQRLQQQRAAQWVQAAVRFVCFAVLSLSQVAPVSRDEGGSALMAARLMRHQTAPGVFASRTGRSAAGVLKEEEAGEGGGRRRVAGELAAVQSLRPVDALTLKRMGEWPESLEEIGALEVHIMQIDAVASLAGARSGSTARLPREKTLGGAAVGTPGGAGAGAAELPLRADTAKHLVHGSRCFATAFLAAEGRARGLHDMRARTVEAVVGGGGQGGPFGEEHLAIVFPEGTPIVLDIEGFRRRHERGPPQGVGGGSPLEASLLRIPTLMPPHAEDVSSVSEANPPGDVSSGADSNNDNSRFRLGAFLRLGSGRVTQWGETAPISLLDARLSVPFRWPLRGPQGGPVVGGVAFFCRPLQGRAAGGGVQQKTLMSYASTPAFLPRMASAGWMLPPHAEGYAATAPTREPRRGSQHSHPTILQEAQAQAAAAASEGAKSLPVRPPVSAVAPPPRPPPQESVPAENLEGSVPLPQTSPSRDASSKETSSGELVEGGGGGALRVDSWGSWFSHPEEEDVSANSAQEGPLSKEASRGGPPSPPREETQGEAGGGTAMGRVGSAPPMYPHASAPPTRLSGQSKAALSRGEMQRLPLEGNPEGPPSPNPLQRGLASCPSMRETRKTPAAESPPAGWNAVSPAHQSLKKRDAPARHQEKATASRALPWQSDRYAQNALKRDAPPGTYGTEGGPLLQLKTLELARVTAANRKERHKL
ncbi:hypothetical protein cyc_03734 [Cyclospora cayetanensis]|uniref:Uncharacterized protein n=1 Tax=Cyclospora cayetanensis TaxID=88456 RepID=A0A1D3D944_9EIME|nr:hypothetical protein cyc_03734 [Cyclospora cayetanensis]